jgi:tetratricopeptide (TPR) repeat protein
MPNEDVIHRFFAGTHGGPNVSIDTTYFLADKPPEALRIVVQGGSSAAGFPYGKWAAPAGMLQQRLQRTWPTRQVEVVTTAMSAVNSYTLLDFQDEILAIEPDAVVIYAGHNEFLGVLGVGSAYSSSLSPALTRLILRLRRLHVVEAAFRIAGPGDEAARETQEGTLMSRIAGERRIPLGSPTFEAGVRQFTENLARLLAGYRAAGVPVLIGTLAANERDQPPFVSAILPPAVAGQWAERARAVEEAMADGRTDAALAAATGLVELDGASADAWYLLGRAAEADRRDREARLAFLAAKDRDELRFRAPEGFNDLIRHTAAANGATLVDVQGRLAAASPRGIIGDGLMLEHLHPNLEGYFLMADAFYDALIAAGVGGPGGQPIDTATARAEIPVTEAGRLAAQWRIERLKGDWPFQETTRPFSLPPAEGEIEGIAQAWFAGRLSWAEAMDQSLVYYQQVGRYGEAARVAVNITMALPFEPNPQFVSGMMLLRDGQTRRALMHLRRAAELAPRDVRYLLGLAQGYFEDGLYPESITVLERVLALEPDHPTAPTFLARARAAAGG